MTFTRDLRAKKPGMFPRTLWSNGQNPEKILQVFKVYPFFDRKSSHPMHTSTQIPTSKYFFATLEKRFFLRFEKKNLEQKISSN